MAFDGEITQTILPGQRLLRGEIVTFNLDLLNLHRAREALANMGDLKQLTDQDLLGLRAKAIRVSNADRTPISPAFTVELTRRGLQTSGARVAA